MRLLGADMQDNASTRLAQRTSNWPGELKNGFYSIVPSEHHEDSKASPRNVLLMFQVAVHRDQDLESRLDAATQQLAVLDARPPSLDYSLYLMATQLVGELARHGFIEENAHPSRGPHAPTPVRRRLVPA